mmetsp:Transcript_19925/g.55396  ORF Transcript_19925/g.55396 Transcript_19925/m.55396 type:complete len:361 (+) Transcript_19925:520-1602(+)
MYKLISSRVLGFACSLGSILVLMLMALFDYRSASLCLPSISAPGHHARVHVHLQASCRLYRWDSLLWNSVDDIEEVSLQGGTANQSTIDVWLRQQTLSIRTLHRSSVLNTDRIGHGLGHVCAHPLADVGVCLLCHLWCGGQSSTNGPHWLIRDGHVCPLFWLEELGERLELLGAHIHGDTRFSLFLLLTDGEHDLESVVKGDLALVGTELLWLTCHTESLSSFGVSDDDPRTSEVLELVRSDFSSVGTVGCVDSAVLGTDGDIGTKHGQPQKQVWVRDAENDFHILRNGTCFIEDLHAFDTFRERAVALPVATDEVLSWSCLSCWSGRSGWACGGERCGVCDIHGEIESVCDCAGRAGWD